MSTTSSFFGGSGGGGDPSGKFQASATVTNGDLVILNNNGTVAPVTSTAIAADYAKSNTGNNFYNGSTPTYGMTAYSGNYNQTHNKYLFFYRQDHNSYGVVKSATYNSSTKVFENISQRLETAMEASWLSQKRSPNEGYLLGYRQPSNGYIRVRGQRWNGSDWSTTSEANANTGSSSQTDLYIEASGDGSSSFAIGGMSNSTCPMVVHGTWDGTSSTPVMTNNMVSQNSDTKNNTFGTNWTTQSLAGAHVKNDIHVFAGKKNGDAYMFACKVEASGTTYGNPVLTGYAHSGYTSRIIYDDEVGVGVYQFYSGTGGGGPKYLAFSVDVETLVVTVHRRIDMPTDFTGYGSGIGWNPTAKTWVAVDHLGGEIYSFTLNNVGQTLTSNTGQFAPGYTGSPSVAMQFQHMLPIHGSGGIGIMFNGDATISGGGAGSYMNATNRLFISRFDIPYTDTNIDSHFGEAKEAIASGAAGSVGILNRSIDITGSSFQKGQKLFANPSGTALATSGTYRVGHATDGDSVLVLGDPS